MISFYALVSTQSIYQSHHVKPFHIYWAYWNRTEPKLIFYSMARAIKTSLWNEAISVAFRWEMYYTSVLSMTFVIKRYCLDGNCIIDSPPRTSILIHVLDIYLPNVTLSLIHCVSSKVFFLPGLLMREALVSQRWRGNQNSWEMQIQDN